MPKLPLADMHERHRALTFHLAGAYSEAAAVCLTRHHVSPVVFRIEDDETSSDVDVAWIEPDLRTIHAWNNTTDTTRDGAYACVIAAAELSRAMFAVRRAETATGADYYLGPAGAGVDDLENCVRLEVSGVDHGERREVIRRLIEKIAQARNGASSLPAVAGVVGYRSQLILLKDVPEES